MLMKGLAWALGPAGWGSYAYEFENGQPRLSLTNQTPDSVLAPGFVDIHIHGANGIDFMTHGRSEMRDLADFLQEKGVESFLPTTVTASAEEVKAALKALPDHPAVAGFHLEGPFISPEYPGAQRPEAIELPPSPGSTWDQILDDPRLKVITLAPERPGALELIRRLDKRGVRVSMGHTAATYEQAKAGFEAGVRNSTHTFNAMRPFHHREAGSAGFCLAEPELWAELIYDRIHVSPGAARTLLQAKPRDRVIAISDSTLAAGLPAGQRISMWGLDCITGEGEVRLASNGALAGSGVTLDQVFHRLWKDFGPEVAVRSACWNPRAAIGLTAAPRIWQHFDLEGTVLARVMR